MVKVRSAAACCDPTNGPTFMRREAPRKRSRQLRVGK